MNIPENILSSLTDEQKKKVESAQSPEEILALAKEAGYELSQNSLNPFPEVGAVNIVQASANTDPVVLIAICIDHRSLQPYRPVIPYAVIFTVTTMLSTLPSRASPA